MPALDAPALYLAQVETIFQVDWTLGQGANPFNFTLPQHATPTGLILQLRTQRVSRNKCENTDPTTEIRYFTVSKHLQVVPTVATVGYPGLPFSTDQELVDQFKLVSYDGTPDFQGPSGHDAEVATPLNLDWSAVDAGLLTALTGAGTVVLALNAFHGSAHGPTSQATWLNTDRVVGILIARVLIA